MSFNIVDLVKDQVSDQLMGSIGSALGVQNTQVTSAVSGALPGLLSGLTNSSSTSQGASALFDAVQKQDDGMLGNIGNLLGGNEASSVANKGSSVLSSLLGTGALGTLAGTVAGAAGIERSSSSSILGMLAPIVLGVLKKKIFDGGMNSNALASMMSSQQSNINAAMPSGFADQLQSGGFFDSIANASSNVTSEVAQTATTATNHAQNATEQVAESASSGGGFMKWLIPVAVLAVLAWLAMQFFGGSSVDDAGSAAGEAVSEVADSAGSMSAEALQSARDAMPEGVNFDEINDGLSGVFSSTTDTLSGITDLDSASAAIPALEEVSGNLGGLSDIISGLPDAAKGPISSIIGSGMENLQPLIEKVSAIPGVGDLISPVIGPLMETLQGLAG